MVMTLGFMLQTDKEADPTAVKEQSACMSWQLSVVASKIKMIK